MPPKKPAAKKSASAAAKLRSIDAQSRPELSPSYMRRSRSPSRSPSRARVIEMCEFLTPELIENMQRFRLVIDLDATFVSSHLEGTAFSNLNRILSGLKSEGKVPPDVISEIESRLYVFDLDATKVVSILRPGSLDFVEFASLYFKSVSVWSAGHRDYVEQIVSFLFPAHLNRPGIVFSWDECQEEHGEGGKSASPSNDKYVPFTKPLSEFLKHITPKGEESSLAETLILDDRSDIALHNKDNLIQIPPFEPRIKSDHLLRPDYALNHLMNWLLRKEVILAPDVRLLNAPTLFKGIDVSQPPSPPTGC